MAGRDELAAGRFACTKRERALFEAGIKMGTIYHQFVGTPVSIDTVESLEEGIRSAISVQPYVESVSIRIDRSRFVRDGDRYSYVSMTGDMIDAVVTIRIGDSRVTAEMRYDKEMGYPLMFVSDIY